ncbi:MAG: hypothetical protein D3924_10765 [Candidatus Electrothrix sp. AR4]|nr:hypothetical protein [Candidatus Electrothrix sp. AR4]
MFRNISLRVWIPDRSLSSCLGCVHRAKGPLLSTNLLVALIFIISGQKQAFCQHEPVKTNSSAHDLQAELLQGTMKSPKIRYDLNKQASNFTVNVSRVDLATIVELMKVKDMQATGTISGKIPVKIQGKKISVDNGALYNDPPGGGISYAAPDAHLTGLSEYALKAIKDFRYTALKSTAEYDPSGRLDLAVSLQGISPEIDSRRSVHFNINIEQNLNTLLQGLRYSKGLGEKIDKRVQQRYK